MSHTVCDETVRGRSTLVAALCVGRGWLNQIAPENPQRDSIAQMRDYIGDRLVAKDWTPETLAAVRAMFCVNCHKVQSGLAAICAGKPIHECFLLD